MRFTRHYKDTTQERSTISMSFCYKFIGLLYTCVPKNYQNRAWFENVIAKVKWCSFCYLQCTCTIMFSLYCRRCKQSWVAELGGCWEFLAVGGRPRRREGQSAEGRNKMIIHVKCMVLMAEHGFRWMSQEQEKLEITSRHPTGFS